MDKLEVINSTQIFDGFIKLNLDTVIEPGFQKPVKRVLVKTKAAGAMVAVNQEGKFILVEQYRYSHNKYFIEIPAGYIDEGETPVQAAIRELKEETGYDCENVDKLLTVNSAIGFSDSTLHIFKATATTQDKQNLDEQENIKILEMDEEQIYHELHLSNSLITDAKTLVGLFSYLADDM